METTSLLFVSHSHEDDPFCLRLIADLRANLGDAAVWYDTSGGLHGGDDWWDRIIAEITERPYFLVVLSPNASASKWVPEEMAIAYRQKVELGKHLLPVRLADAPRREDWKGIQEFDFSHASDPARYAAALAEVLRFIDPKLTSPVISATPVSQTPAAPERPLSPTERLAQETHTAYAREHWSDVLDKTEILVERGAMTPALWRERASAAFALGDNKGGLAVVKQALQAGVDDADTLLLYVRLTAKAGDDKQAVEILTRAYALVPLNDIATRLVILNELTAVLTRLGRWDDLARRVSDARRMAPDDPYWALRWVEMLLGTRQYDESIAVVRSLPAGANAKRILPAWRAAISSAATDRGMDQNWITYRALLDAARAAQVDSSAIARWKFEFPHFVPLITFSGLRGDEGSVAWSPDGTRIATFTRRNLYLYTAGGKDEVRVWDIASGRMVTVRSGAVSSVAWSPDGTRIATTESGSVHVWNATSGRRLATLSDRAVDTTIRYARRALGSLGGSYYTPRMLVGVTWSPDGTRLAATNMGENKRPAVHVWDADNGHLLTTFPGGEASWSPDGTQIATDSADGVRVWDAASGHLLATFSGVHLPVAWSPDGTRLAIASTEGVKVWDAASRRLVNALASNTKAVRELTWAPDGRRLLIIENRNDHYIPHHAGIWDAASGHSLVTFTGLADGGIEGIKSSIAWSSDGERLVGAAERRGGAVRGDLKIWDAASGRELDSLVHSLGYEWTAGAWSADGTQLTTINGKTATIWGEE